MLPQDQTCFPRTEPIMRPFVMVSAGGGEPREYRYPTGKTLQLRGRDTGSSGIKQRREWGGSFIHTQCGLPNTSPPSYCETTVFFSVSSPKLRLQTIGVTEIQGHLPSLSTNICGATPTCLVLTLLPPSSGLPRGGARAEELAGTPWETDAEL